jgi:hypothetical protein
VESAALAMPMLKRSTAAVTTKIGRMESSNPVRPPELNAGGARFVPATVQRQTQICRLFSVSFFGQQFYPLFLDAQRNAYQGLGLQAQPNRHDSRSCQDNWLTQEVDDVDPDRLHL